MTKVLQNTSAVITHALPYYLLVGFIVLLGLFGTFGNRAEAATTQYYWVTTPSYGTNYGYGLNFNGQYFTNTDDLMAYLRQLIISLQAQIQNRVQTRLQVHYYYGGGTQTYRDGDSEVDVTTLSATDINYHDATLRGTVDFNNSDYAIVWFEYGKTSGDLDQTTTKIQLDDTDDEDFEITIDDLSSDKRYYYRAIAVDDSGIRTYGSTRSFTTDYYSSYSDNDTPDVETDNATSIGRYTATLHGSVDMNDYRNGVVFFVYGEDRDQVDNIADDYDSYSAIDEDGDDLQKYKVDSDLDYDSSYWYTPTGLDRDTTYYFAIGVEYDDDDGDSVIKMGDVERFTTDN